MAEPVHGGLAVTRTLTALGVDHLFTLTGGHIFPILDGAHQDGLRIVDVRHEQTAAFAAEGWARLTRKLGVCAVTAGPGVTNALSALAQASFNRAPVLALAGRAPAFRWGQGSLQEIDHVPFVQPLAEARSVLDTGSVGKEVVEAAFRALTPPRGPQFLDMPLDVLFNVAEVDVEVPTFDAASIDDAAETAAGSVAELIMVSERPVLMAGSNVWLDGGEDPLRALAEKAGLAVFMNGQGRGCLPADHPKAFSRSRSHALKNADLVVVVGTPLDFRLGFGDFGEAKVVHVDSAPTAEHVELATEGIFGPTGAVLDMIAGAISKAPDTSAWLETLRRIEIEKSEAARAELASDSSPIHPMRIYGELGKVLDRDAIVICDGGDFASYAGREIASYEGGSWLDPGPYGCLGCGFGYAMAARSAYPDRQIVLLLGDGALGFDGMEMETLARLGLPVVCLVGNNGIWGLEKHPMRGIYGYDVAAELQPGLRYDTVMEALGGKGETITAPDEIGPALKRAFASGEPYLVNVLTDPEIAYPRSANLA
jgi:acetolactate synthase I/II/III large subunit